MTQDTRKDPRAKIVSLNVRYKSATVDEFIENHSHDVSRGGIFIKTATPFPQGTLLKFEIRLSGDQAVIAGVGRVVWKREAGQSGSERPAGMGVKFIKIDEGSRAVIDRLVSTRADAGLAFTSELKDGELLAAQKGPTPAPSIKRTIMGMGVTPPPPQTDTRSSQRDPSLVSTSAGGFFPPTAGAADMPPPQERTMMKQAAELLEEALKEAGGSMDEVGSNPLFAGPVGAPAAPPPGPSPVEARPIVAVAAPPPQPVHASPEWERPQPGPTETSTAGPLPRLPPLDEDDDSMHMAVAPPAAGRSPAPPAPTPPPPVTAPAPDVRPMSAVARVAQEPAGGKKSGAMIGIAAAALLVLGGVAVFVLKPGLFGGGDTPAATSANIPPPTASVAPVPVPAASSAAPAQSGAPPTADTVATAASAASTTVRPLVADAAAAPVITPPTRPVRPPPTRPPPTATPPADTTATATSTATASPPATATPPSDTATSAPTAAPTSDTPRPKRPADDEL